MPTPDAEYEALAKRLEELRTATDPALSKERADVQRKLTEILVSRRGSDRFQCHVKVDLKSGDTQGQGVMVNLGAGGAYIRTTFALERFADVAVHVTTPGRLPNGSVLTANVRWAKPNDGLGIAFKNLDPAVAEAVRKALGELVREQPPKFDDAT